MTGPAAPWPDEEHVGARAAEPSTGPSAGSWVFATIVLAFVLALARRDLRRHVVSEADADKRADACPEVGA
ncbi:hypothetical protein DEI89_16755 [Curtobacterium sp. MCBD17_030]|nr:hypothetical protein DEI89_16755 [Curtobacterium sp. MCBD17_030]